MMVSPVGMLYLVFRSFALIGISFEKPDSVIQKQTQYSAEARKELSEYFAQRRAEFALRTIFVEGTPFEKEVWGILKEIPYGETRTYKWIADRIGKPHACRAVGNALGKNPLPVIFPCHRIIESDGSLGGYTPGVEIKRRLLEIEYYGRPSQR